MPYIIPFFRNSHLMAMLRKDHNSEKTPKTLEFQRQRLPEEAMQEQKDRHSSKKTMESGDKTQRTYRKRHRSSRDRDWDRYGERSSTYRDRYGVMSSRDRDGGRTSRDRDKDGERSSRHRHRDRDRENDRRDKDKERERRERDKEKEKDFAKLKVDKDLVGEEQHKTDSGDNREHKP